MVNLFVYLLILLIRLVSIFGSLSIPNILLYPISDSCKSFFVNISVNRQTLINDLLPGDTFFKILSQMKIEDNPSTIFLIDVTNESIQLLVNQKKSLLLSGTTNFSYLAISYDTNRTCELLNFENIACYYDPLWLDRMGSFWRYMKNPLKKLELMHYIMLGRSAVLISAICLSYNVFLLDTDIVFFRNPLNNITNDIDAKVTLGMISFSDKHWGGKYFPNVSDDYYSLNNGVIFYHNTNATSYFVLNLFIKAAESLWRNVDSDRGFLQITFNKLLNKNSIIFPSVQRYPKNIIYVTVDK